MPSLAIGATAGLVCESLSYVFSDSFFLLSFFGQLVVASMAVADLKKSLDSLERSQKLIAQLALATDKDVCREKIRHELIVHLRGPAVGEVQQLFMTMLSPKNLFQMSVPRSLAILRVMTRRHVLWLTQKPGIPTPLRLCGSSFGPGFFNASSSVPPPQKRLVPRWLWQRLASSTPWMGRLFFMLSFSQP